MKKKHVIPEEDPTSIGNILIEMGLLSKDKLDYLVKKFRDSKEELLGEFIVRHTKDEEVSVKPEHVEIALMKQHVLRNGGRPTHAAVISACGVTEKIGRRIIDATEEITALTASIAEKV